MGVGDSPDRFGVPQGDDPVVLTRVETEQEAAVLCGALRAEGIRCGHDEGGYNFAGGRSLTRIALGVPQTPTVAVYVSSQDVDAAMELVTAWAEESVDGVVDDRLGGGGIDASPSETLHRLRIAVDDYRREPSPPEPTDCPRLGRLYEELGRMSNYVLEMADAALNDADGPWPVTMVQPYLEERLEMETHVGSDSCRELAGRYVALVRQLELILELVPVREREVADLTRHGHGPEPRDSRLELR